MQTPLHDEGASHLILECRVKCWKSHLPGRAAGDVVRALAWLGPEKAGDALGTLRAKLSPAEMQELASARAGLPAWLALAVGALVSPDLMLRTVSQ